MKRMKKAMLLPIRGLAYHWKFLRLFYWSEKELFELRTVCCMPIQYYRWLYRVCLWLIGFSQLRKLANKAIHTIPLQVRFALS